MVSKAFTKETDGRDELPPVVDEALPPGVKNYVTPAGLVGLREQIEKADEAHRKMLLRRLEAAEAIDPLQQAKDRVLFGATVTVRDEGEKQRVFRIVGIDEADAKRGWISWRSPIAAALLNQRVGAVVTVHTPRGDEDWEVIAIEYRA